MHRAEPICASVDIEELRLLLHIGQRTEEVIAPPVVLAGELATRPPGFLVWEIVPHQLVSAVPADVVEAANHIVLALDDDHRRAGGLDLFSEVAADPGQLLDAS